MFRAAAAGPFDEVVAQATDENLTSEDWGAIMTVCDRVSADNSGPKEAVQSIIKRLAHRNANVQLYTLELANALSQNCGKEMHRELASRAFTDALLKLANDRNTHNQVKVRILERMKEWSDMFKNDADLGIMYDAFYRLKQTNPTLEPPSAPQKNNLTDLDRQKEEEELQMALKLSLQEEERKKKTSESATATASTSAAGGAAAAAAEIKPVASGTTAATVSRVRALYDFVPSESGELEFKKGDVIAVLESVYKDWWRGSLRGKTGIFPLNYVEKLTDPTPEELQREAQMEAEVFAEIKNVEKLLTLLSASNTSPREEDNDEIALNEKFIKARRDYEALLESSMAHPPQPSYHQYMPGPPQPGYPPQGGPGGPPHDAQRFYTPGPQDYHGVSPPPGNFQRPSQATPAPFYVAGAEIPSGGNPHAPSQQQSYPIRPGPTSSGSAGQPAPINTSSPPPASNQYTAYSQVNQRPGSTYGAQELATSVYDSPIAPHNQNSLNPAAPYSPDDPYNPPNAGGPLAQPTAPAAHAQPSQPQYQSYNPSQNQAQYDGAPPAPSGAAPPVPQALAPGRPENAVSPPPGGLYDARQGLPSQAGNGHPQYKPYVPPSSEPSAPGPADYYRQPSGY
ncbi:Class E vacuolar protein-sorting machinery protein hse-1 [Scedosporium apiospermum]|uniref:Class E vacuolar protein-sorting machinery protein HSE1 n=1 Tax=Pseudallescheria apiosperma TaxID=563466 RepID=A0A084FUU5_PSEDA|nr:Class E vacuolar protein-sorting machinery protein hse-1 [Scedosporium apiospermum]KEZ38857.1 Class E vacuolar protein-sorting machinery protein hse-1 [Scedosporium apiospermum]